MEVIEESSLIVEGPPAFETQTSDNTEVGALLKGRVWFVSHL